MIPTCMALNSAPYPPRMVQASSSARYSSKVGAVTSGRFSAAGSRRLENGFDSTRPTLRASSYIVPMTRETLRGTVSAQVRADSRSTSPIGVGPKCSAKRRAAVA